MKNTLRALGFLLVSAFLTASGATQDEPRPLNVLFIAVDDLRTELGCYDVAHARSPHIDQLASEGVVFKNHFVQVPTCGASRYALLTGRSPARSGVTGGNAALYRGPTRLLTEEQPGAQSLPELFRRSGYRTVCIGKISHTADGRVFEYNGQGDGRHELPGGWDELATPFGAWKRGWGVFFAYEGGRHREDGQGHRDLMEFVAEEDEDLPDGLIANEAASKLKELAAKDQPFFLGVGFFKPHLPFVATKGDWEAMAKVDVPPPTHGEKPDTAYWHQSGEFYKYAAPFEKNRPLAVEDRIHARRAYLSCVRYVDRQVGKVLQALDDCGLRESTVVVLWGDHGWHLGESAIWGKHSPHERAVRSALVIRAPGVSKPGLECEGPVETIDLYPTLVDLCEPSFRKTEHPLDGKSLRPLLTGEAASVREAARSYWNQAVSVRTSTHRLIAKTGDTDPKNVELYDLRSGPDPVKNLATEDPATTARLQALLPLPEKAPLLEKARPNVVLVITDDQGYGDLSCHGNPTLKTPNLDRLHAESVRLVDYHVAPTCSPTRAALQTGHWTNRTGVWHTIMGRSMLREDEVTIGEVFRRAGYATGMFGKWHLGDNMPCRPEDRGYTEVMRHGGGGVGQTPDFWDNAYFDGTYFHNSTPEPVEGFCTDVWFDYAQRFVREQKAQGRPFFAYISTNAPHGPMHSPTEASAPYAEEPVNLANFHGMIANIDENVGRLRAFLEGEGLAENTIFIFTTDNGTAMGEGVFNAGMRGKKGSEYDGGHRVPFFLRWPARGFVGGRDVDPIAAHVDVLPTLIDLCEIEPPAGVRFDGRSIRPLLEAAGNPEPVDWPDRVLITDSQRVKDPIRWRKSAVMTSRWRLVNGTELYDIDEDPGQKEDVALQHPDVVKRLADAYEAWWDELEPTFARDVAIVLGDPAENPARLTAHDWITTGSTPWNQASIRNALGGERMTGFWNVDVARDGEYEITMRRWPREVDAAIDAGLEPGAEVPGARAFRARPGKAVPVVRAILELGDQRVELPVEPGAPEVSARLELKAGRTRLYARFQTADGTEIGAYYCYVERR